MQALAFLPSLLPLGKTRKAHSHSSSGARRPAGLLRLTFGCSRQGFGPNSVHFAVVSSEPGVISEKCICRLKRRFRPGIIRECFSAIRGTRQSETRPAVLGVIPAIVELHIHIA